MDLKQLLGDRAAELGDARIRPEAPPLEEYLAGQRISVRVQTGGGQPDEHVPRGDPRTVDDVLALDHADDEPRQVVLARLVEVGHLGRLAADQRAAGVPAGTRQTGDHLQHHVPLDLPHGDVVEEEERHRSLDQDVVDAVIHEVHADGLVVAGLDRHLQLGADAVGAAHEDRPAERAGGRQVVQTAERADLRQDPLLEGATGDQPDALDGAHLGVDVDAGVPVGESARRRVPALDLPGRRRGTRGALPTSSLHTPRHGHTSSRGHVARTACFLGRELYRRRRRGCQRTRSTPVLTHGTASSMITAASIPVRTTSKRTGGSA